jgi:hypothetical protein
MVTICAISLLIINFLFSVFMGFAMIVSINSDYFLKQR